MYHSDHRRTQSRFPGWHWMLGGLASFIFLLTSGGQFVHAQEESSDNQAVDAALGSLFDVRRAPTAKSMGLLQGSFLEAINPRQKLQLAFVIDSTRSMEKQLAAIRKQLPNLVADLGRLVDGKVESAIVSFSDAGGDNPVQLISPTFMNVETFNSSLQKLEVTSGEPYFCELIDLGVHDAIKRLPWSTRKDTQKWIFLMGDAPPYEPGFDEPKNKAKRRVETSVLTDLANQKNIKIHCLLCESRAEESKAFRIAVDRTRQFMSKLSSETGGLMLDTSYAQVKSQLLETAKRNRTRYSKVGLISRNEIESIRKKIAEASAGDEIKRLAVLPLVPIDQMTFDFDRSEVQIAMELRKMLRNSPRLRLVQPRDIENEIERLKAQQVAPKDWTQAICSGLRVDFVISGSVRTRTNGVAAEVSVFGGQQSQPHVKVSVSTDSISEISGEILLQLSRATKATTSYLPLKNHLMNLAKSQNDRFINGFPELDPAARKNLFGATAAMEQALGYSAINPEGKKLLYIAEEKLNQILQEKPKAIAHTLLGSCKFNLARFEEHAGKLAAAKKLFSECRDQIKQAYFLKNDLIDPLSKLEVTADYHLLVKKDPKTAADYYRQITEQNTESPVHHGLRAHWMLAGIHSGDWGVLKDAPNLVSTQQARQHLVNILVHWPESSEAKTIRKHLRWTSKEGGSQSPYFPLEGDLLTGT